MLKKTVALTTELPTLIPVQSKGQYWSWGRVTKWQESPQESGGEAAGRWRRARTAATGRQEAAAGRSGPAAEQPGPQAPRPGWYAAESDAGGGVT